MMSLTPMSAPLRGPFGRSAIRRRAVSTSRHTKARTAGSRAASAASCRSASAARASGEAAAQKSGLSRSAPIRLAHGNLDAQERSVLLAAEDIGVADAAAGHLAIDGELDGEAGLELHVVADAGARNAVKPADGHARQRAA